MSDVRLIDIVFAALEGDEWSPVEVEGENRVIARFSGENAEFHVEARTSDEKGIVLFWAMGGVDLPAERYGAMMEFVTRANYGMLLGNFEFDPDEGDLRFKSSLDTEGVPLQPQLVINLAYSACLALDRYAPGIAAIVQTECTASEAIELVEG